MNVWACVQVSVRVCDCVCMYVYAWACAHVFVWHDVLHMQMGSWHLTSTYYSTLQHTTTHCNIHCNARRSVAFKTPTFPHTHPPTHPSIHLPTHTYRAGHGGAAGARNFAGLCKYICIFPFCGSSVSIYCVVHWDLSQRSSHFSGLWYCSVKTKVPALTSVVPFH